MHTWQELYEMALKVNNQKKITPFISSGSITCVIESTSGKLYVGNNIISNNYLDICAEKNAITNMITTKEYNIDKMLIINEIGELILPCNNCSEYLFDLYENNKFKILIDINKEKTTTISEILPDHHGTIR